LTKLDASTGALLQAERVGGSDITRLSRERQGLFASEQVRHRGGESREWRGDFRMNFMKKSTPVR